MLNPQEILYNEVRDTLYQMIEGNFLEAQEHKFTVILGKLGFIKNIDYKMSYRYKTEASIKEKLERKHYKRAFQMTDLAGLKIVFKDLATTQQFNEVLLQELDSFICSYNDYYNNPKSSEYKSIHFEFEFDGFPLEVQIKDCFADLKQSFLHDRVYKNPRYKDIVDPLNAEMIRILDFHYGDKCKSLDFSLTDADISALEKDIELVAARLKGEKRIR